MIYVMNRLAYTNLKTEIIKGLKGSHKQAEDAMCDYLTNESRLIVPIHKILISEA